MKMIPETTAPVNSLLDALARRGYDRPAVVSLLTAGFALRFQNMDARGNRTYAATPGGHTLQITVGKTNGVGCITCTAATEAQRGLRPGSISRLENTCAPCGAAIIQVMATISHKAKYAGAFHAWLNEQTTAPAIVATGAGAALVSEPVPAMLSPEKLAALDLASEYPALTGRIEKALALVEAGEVEFPQYRTAWQNLTREGNWVCECPDAQHRAPRTKSGVGCKHALAGEISRRVESDRKATAYRRLSDIIERDRARIRATQAGYDIAKSPGAGSGLHTPRYQFGR